VEGVIGSWAVRRRPLLQYQTSGGDVSDVLYKQNNISAGDAVKAVLNIYDRLKKN
jgi:alkyl hydroperoxide reductase subunit AhpF